MLKPLFGVTYISYFDLFPVAQGEKKFFLSCKHNNGKKKVLSFIILGNMSNKFASSEE